VNPAPAETSRSLVCFSSCPPRSLCLALGNMIRILRMVDTVAIDDEKPGGQGLDESAMKTRGLSLYLGVVTRQAFVGQKQGLDDPMCLPGREVEALSALFHHTCSDGYRPESMSRERAGV